MHCLRGMQPEKNLHSSQAAGHSTYTQQHCWWNILKGPVGPVRHFELNCRDRMLQTEG